MWQHIVPRFLIVKWLSTVKTDQRQANFYKFATDSFEVRSAYSVFARENIYDMPGARHSRLEKSFSNLERNTSGLLRQLDAAREVRMTRSEVACLKTFLFLLGERNTATYRRFIDDGVEGSISERAKAHSRRYGMESNTHVWLEGLARVLQADGDRNILGDQHIVSFTREALQADSDKRLRLFRAPPKHHFVLTDCGFGIGQDDIKLYAISPTRLIVLCPSHGDSNQAPRLERSDGGKPSVFQFLRDTAHHAPSAARSVKTRGGEGDEYTIPIHDLDKHYVAAVNAFILGHVDDEVMFTSPSSLLRSLRLYQNDAMLSSRAFSRIETLRRRLEEEQKKKS